MGQNFDYEYVDRDWPKAKMIFVPGDKKPPSANSVKGQLYDIVTQHPEGITGEELVKIAQRKIRTPRSHHAMSEPDEAWVRRYVSGMTRPTFGFLRAVEPQSH